MVKFANEFDVAMEGFETERFFGAELPYNPFMHLWSLLRGRGLGSDVRRLTLEHLCKVAARGSWFAPDN